MSDRRTITLSDRAPVTIVETDWPVIAQASEHDNQHEFQANRTWHLYVRRHADGRVIVYGVYRTKFEGEHDRRGGHLLDPGENIASHISGVAKALGFDERMAQECIADLPAEELY